MARGKPIVLATRSFPNQLAATAHFKAILNSYGPGDGVGEEHSLDLSALLERHSEYAEKVGSGVDHFEVMMTEHGTKCFRIIRTDGTGTDFSYPHCIRGRPPSRKQEVSQALRRAVRMELYRARDKFFAEHRDAEGLISCAVTGDRIRPEQGHMDHRAPLTFEVIVTTFMEMRGLSFDDIPITTGRDEQVAPEICDEALAEEFRQYHARVARLDFVKDTVNLAQSSRERVKASRIRLT